MDSGGLASSEGLVALEDLEQLRRRKEKSPVFRLTDTISLSHRLFKKFATKILTKSLKTKLDIC